MTVDRNEREGVLTEQEWQAELDRIGYPAPTWRLRNHDKALRVALDAMERERDQWKARFDLLREDHNGLFDGPNGPRYLIDEVEYDATVARADAAERERDALRAALTDLMDACAKEGGADSPRAYGLIAEAWRRAAALASSPREAQPEPERPGPALRRAIGEPRP